MSSQAIRVVIADDLKLQRQMVKASFASEDRFRIVGEAATGAELVEVAKREKPDLVLTDLNMPVLDGAQAVRILSFTLPGCVFIVFSGEEDIERLRPVVSAGASDFLRKPLQMNRLVESVLRIYDREAPRKQALLGEGAPQDSTPRIGFVSPQAGSGASTLAANMAVALTKVHPRVALLDFDFQTATLTQMMGQSGTQGLLELLQSTDQLAWETLEPFLVQAHGVLLLPGTPFPLDAARRDPEILLALVELVAAHTDCVVLDLEPRMDETNLALLGRCDRTYLVVGNEAGQLRAASRWMAVYNYSKPAPDRCRLLLNQSFSQAKIPGAEVARTVGLGIWGDVAHDPANAQMSAFQSRPAILDGETNLGQSLRTLAQKLVDKGL